LGSASNYQIINTFIFKDLVFTHVHKFIFNFFDIASMTRFFEIFRKLFELRLVNYTFSQKQTFVNQMTNFVFKNWCTSTFELCCFVMYRVRNIVNREEKVMSYVLVVQSVYLVL